MCNHAREKLHPDCWESSNRKVMDGQIRQLSGKEKHPRKQLCNQQKKFQLFEDKLEAFGFWPRSALQSFSSDIPPAHPRLNRGPFAPSSTPPLSIRHHLLRVPDAFPPSNDALRRTEIKPPVQTSSPLVFFFPSCSAPLASLS